MRKFLAGGIALTIVAGAIAASVVEARSEASPRVQVVKSFAELANVLNKVSLGANGFRDPQSDQLPTCIPDAAGTCSIHVNIIQTYDTSPGGTPFGCILKVDDVAVDRGVKNINWSLWMLPASSALPSAAVPAASSGSTNYKFYPGYEILVVERDDAEQLPTKTTNSDGSVSAPYKNKMAKHHVKYYPVVAQNLGDKKELLCGSLDPKIVNN